MVLTAHLAVLWATVLPALLALENGLARTPPMGWMHWQRFRCITDCEAYPDECVSEELFRVMAKHLATDGYLQAGYEYVMIDDCWSSKERDSEGRLQPDPVRFPHGIKPLADYIHSLGLKFGIYADYGTLTCGGYPGSKYHLEVDAKTFAEWGVDYLKFDGCYTDYHDIEEGYVEMGKYLNATGRPIAYSCSWPAYQEPEGLQSNYSKLAETCNLWRNWDDIEDSWDNVTDIVDWFSGNQDRIANFSGPGHWNDPDMLLIGNYGLSYEQSKAQMAIWTVMAAPLIMSVDLRTIDPRMRELLLNKAAIKVNQDPLGIMGRLVLQREKIDIWTKPVLPIVDESFSYAIALMSRRVDGYPRRINFTLTELNITHPPGFTIKDLMGFQIESSVTYKEKDLIILRVPPTGGILLLATPEGKIKQQTDILENKL